MIKTLSNHRLPRVIRDNETPLKSGYGERSCGIGLKGGLPYTVKGFPKVEKQAVHSAVCQREVLLWLLKR